MLAEDEVDCFNNIIPCQVTAASACNLFTNLDPNIVETISYTDFKLADITYNLKNTQTFNRFELIGVNGSRSNNA